MNCLILCAGRTRRDGWKTLDANPANEPDFACVIPPLPPTVTTVQWDVVEWVHGITSFYPWDAEKILRELASCIKPTGRLILEQPNVRVIDAAQHPEWIFGDPTLKNPLHMNKWAYTPVSLAQLLKRCGFVTAILLPAQYHVPDRDFRIEASLSL